MIDNEFKEKEIQRLKGNNERKIQTLKEIQEKSNQCDIDQQGLRLSELMKKQMQGMKKSEKKEMQKLKEYDDKENSI